MQDAGVAEKVAAFSALAGHEYMRLTTFRKNGEPVPTPVWFAQEDDRLYVVTDAESGKVKRIRRNAQVEVCPCDSRGNPRGDSAEAMARILPEAEVPTAVAALNRKYGWKKRMFELFIGIRRRPSAYLEFTPME